MTPDGRKVRQIGGLLIFVACTVSAAVMLAVAYVVARAFIDAMLRLSFQGW